MQTAPLTHMPLDIFLSKLVASRVPKSNAILVLSKVLNAATVIAVETVWIWDGFLLSALSMVPLERANNMNATEVQAMSLQHFV